nr:MAG TPA: Major capsid protein [Caudoviricetes sp.]
MDGNATNTATGTTANNGAGTQQAAANNTATGTTAAAGAGTQQAADNNATTKTQQATQSTIDVDKVKSDAVSALLKELGYEDVDALKTVTTKAKAEEDAKKSDLEKKDEALTAMTRQLATEREARIVAEAKNAAIKLGAKPELVDDLVIVAKSKVTKDKDINAVITEIKDSTVGGVYFVKDNNTNQTGTGAGTVTRGQVHKKATTQQAAQNNNAADGDDEAHAGTMAARLLAKRKTAKKGYYFK